jgi:hypothetical protein
VTFDVKQRQVRVECEALGVEAPLEFFCVRNGGSEHESVLRTPAKASDVHKALLAIGLEPGRPVYYSPSQEKWFPPTGPPLSIVIEWEKDGKTVAVPAYRCMRNLKTKEEMKPVHWVFAGSRKGPDGEYGADIQGYVVSIVNFDYTLIDLPEIRSNSNDLLEWVRNADAAPPAKTKVTMVIEPAGKDDPKKDSDTAPKGKADAGGEARPAPNAEITDVTVDQARMDALRDRWLRAVRPHAAALREASQVHYEVIEQMRAEQHRLINEADRLQRAIDALEKEYQELTTPRPSPAQ